MLLADFDYDLPPELIAQEPTPERASSRLLALARGSQQITHRQFSDIVSLLPPDSLLVLNDTRVFPARLRGHKESGGRIELLLLRRLPGTAETWEVMSKGTQGMKEGSRIVVTPECSGVWVTAPHDGRGELRFSLTGADSFFTLLDRVGEIPLPPYIKRTLGTRPEDHERYQTVYARHVGAVAAPTAGLHFTPELLATVQERGIEVVFLTLHVGAGTFQPVRSEHIESHVMEEEEYEISEDVAQRVNTAKHQGRKIIAVGTTSTRALESAWHDGSVQVGRHRSSLFIYPGFPFQVIDGLITNFHLPRSTLLMLVSAFAGREVILEAYKEAIRQHYRFYSYGDAMLIL
ncbi:MAG: tRNA preQ1(34) S-adenosylmethionine ribosyltransferase-isomerase QueA [Deltaproteobacteria bacterium]|nr:tRNA preQ1(34) S-adenosylmethionine ribosyltransferase-isomerase QueA [Deltaproteobacteria bacterium]